MRSRDFRRYVIYSARSVGSHGLSVPRTHGFPLCSLFSSISIVDSLEKIIYPGIFGDFPNPWNLTLCRLDFSLPRIFQIFINSLFGTSFLIFLAQKTLGNFFGNFVSRNPSFLRSFTRRGSSEAGLLPVRCESYKNHDHLLYLPKKWIYQ